MARTVARRRRSDPSPLPQWIAPQLTQLVDAAPDGDQWLHVIKFDGYRMHARLDRGAVKLLTRTGLDWTHKYPAIAEAVGLAGPPPRSRFRNLRRRTRLRRPAFVNR
jgi:bifunctional non-homologous end joining protein LigD